MLLRLTLMIVALLALVLVNQDLGQVAVSPTDHETADLS